MTAVSKGGTCVAGAHGATANTETAMYLENWSTGCNDERRCLVTGWDQEQLAMMIVATWGLSQMMLFFVSSLRQAVVRRRKP